MNTQLNIFSTENEILTFLTKCIKLRTIMPSETKMQREIAAISQVYQDAKGIERED